MKDCRAKKAGKPKAVMGSNSLERSHAPAAADWYEDREAGPLVFDCRALLREDDYEWDGAEMTGQDWVQENKDDKEYDDSFVPPGGFPTEPEARMYAPADTFAVSGPRNFPTGFADESAPVINMTAEDPWVRDGDPWLGYATHRHRWFHRALWSHL